MGPPAASKPCLPDPLTGEWRAARAAKRRSLCLQPQQLSRGLACELLSHREARLAVRGPQGPKKGRGPPEGPQASARLSPLSLKISSQDTTASPRGRILPPILGDIQNSE